jgi:hypothetical protein
MFQNRYPADLMTIISISMRMSASRSASPSAGPSSLHSGGIIYELIWYIGRSIICSMTIGHSPIGRWRSAFCSTKLSFNQRLSDQRVLDQQLLQKVQKRGMLPPKGRVSPIR